LARRKIQAPEIRVLSDADAEEFWAVRLRALREEPRSFGSSYEESVLTPQADIAKRMSGADGSFILGAFAPHLVGTVGCRRRSGIKTRHKAVIWGMYVTPEHRGTHLGRGLLTAAIARASAMEELTYLMLQVVTTNQAARGLYLSLGFRSYGVEKNALHVEGKFFDEDLMQLDLHTTGPKTTRGRRAT
jgi:ribosomal protein S18 acetylase RimI-like enzyme